MFYQTEITLNARAKGFHIVTDVIERQIPEMSKIK